MAITAEIIKNKIVRSHLTTNRLDKYDKNIFKKKKKNTKKYKTAYKYIENKGIDLYISTLYNWTGVRPIFIIKPRKKKIIAKKSRLYVELIVKPANSESKPHSVVEYKKKNNKIDPIKSTDEKNVAQ